MMGARGTPIVAVIAGTALAKDNSPRRASRVAHRLERLQVLLRPPRQLRGPAEPVDQGDVIGYMGDTGNARGTVHLHFEVHPGRRSGREPLPLRPIGLLVALSRPDSSNA